MHEALKSVLSKENLHKTPRDPNEIEILNSLRQQKMIFSCGSLHIMFFIVVLYIRYLLEIDPHIFQIL